MREQNSRRPADSNEFIKCVVQEGELSTGPRRNAAAPATSLRARNKVLQSVLEKEDHEYCDFAKYLMSMYELTGNTDRHTSKDYVRLCNLKDNYHKQCKSEKDKLKIYRIKSFFSKILELEVTGEWDRHNHGGVRGPYVYGIRERAHPAEEKGIETRNGFARGKCEPKQNR